MRAHTVPHQRVRDFDATRSSKAETEEKFGEAVKFAELLGFKVFGDKNIDN